MIQTKLRFLSFEEYLSYDDDGTENLYELFNGERINGERIEVPLESGENVQIANRLFLVFALLLGTDRVRGHGLELEVRGEPKNRYPDLTIIREEHIQLLKSRNTIRLNMAPPLRVIEVVSLGDLQRDRDYIAKQSQYQDIGIPEYWIVDPQDYRVTVLTLVENTYSRVESFQGKEGVRSPQFPDLQITSAQISGSGT